MVVMIALATPFGSFISEAVQSTTKGLFDVNKSALDSTGLINIDNQEFDVPDMNHGAGNGGNVGEIPTEPESPTDPNEPQVTIITFTIEGTTYQAEEGMTWAQWVETDYNAGKYFSESNYMITKDGTTYVTDGVAEVMHNSVIVNGKQYYYGSFPLRPNYPAGITITTQINGIPTTDITYTYNENDGTYKFVYNRNGDLQGWEFPYIVEGADYDIVDEDCDTQTWIIIKPINYDGEIIANAIVYGDMQYATVKLDYTKYTTEYAQVCEIKARFSDNPVNISEVFVTSSDNNIATVEFDHKDNSIVVYPLSAGKVTVTIRYGNSTSSCEVTINPK